MLKHSKRFNQAMAKRLAAELARPAPLVLVFLKRVDYAHTRKLNPITGQEIIALTYALYRVLDDTVFRETGKPLSEFVEVVETPEHEAVMVLDLSNKAELSCFPDAEMPDFVEIRIRP